MFTPVPRCFALACIVLSAEYVGAQTLVDAGTPSAALNVAATQPPPGREREERRPPVLVPLYVSLVALQVADGVTTYQAVTGHAAHEVNPAMRPFAGNPAALFAVKGTATAVTMYAVEKLWKKNRVAAVLTMIGVNAAYAMVVANNIRVVH